MGRKLLIRDLTLRDGQQSQLATRMTQEQIDRLLPFFKEANFYATEVWGGAVPDSAMRYLNEDPWERLERIKDFMGDSSKLTALSRGRNLFGYNPYPDDVIEGFNRYAIESGIDIMRIFDALNDIDNMVSTIESVKKYGGEVDCAVCYTVDPKFSLLQKLMLKLSGKSIPPKIFTIDYFVEKAKRLESLGADLITIKDMAGLIDPKVTAELIPALKRELNIPIDLHTHCTPGYGLASVLMGIIKGVDIVDTVIMNFSEGPAAPSVEVVQIFARKLGLDTNLNVEVIGKINDELLKIRKELQAFDKLKKIPRQFHLDHDELPKKVNDLFDKAIKDAQDENIPDLLNHVHKIEKYFNFPAPDHRVQKAEIPGGMYTNMISQLETMRVPHLFDKVLKVIPTVRLDAGLVPLVTPTSQIVGAQTVTSVINRSKRKPFYSQVSLQFKNLVMGKYGKTPYPIDPDFREKITGHREEVPYDVDGYEKAENSIIDEIGVPLAENEREELLLELFPSVARDFLRKSKIEKFRDLLEKKSNEEYATLTEALRDDYQN